MTRVPWNAAAGEAIGATFLFEAIAPGGQFGRRARERERAFRRGDEGAAHAAIARVACIARRVPSSRLEALRAAIAEAPDPGTALVRAQSGGVLADVDFFDVVRFLDAVADVAALATDAAALEGADTFADVAIFADAGFAALDTPRGDVTLRAALAPGRTSNRAFYLDDAFDARLASLRAASEARQADYDAARSRLGERAARYAGIEHVRDGEFVVMRDRLTSAVPPEIRVVREAPTYVLCELALDAAALGALGARDAAAAEVADAEEAVRARLSRHVAAAGAALERACDALGELDSLLARAQFAQRFACVVPDIIDTNAIVFRDARYLPLAAALDARGGRYAPISLELSGVGVVTGPNMGGKTVALRTLGFLTACVALGLPVPAHSASVPLVDEIAWLGLGTISEDGLLSAFGAEVVQLRTFLCNDVTRALVLVDEFARTTSPREGRALLVALLEELASRQTFGLAATHLAHVAADAGVAHYAIGGLGKLATRAAAPLDLDAALRRIAFAMDYTLSRVDERAVPAADAIALAEALGLDERLIARARAAL